MKIKRPILYLIAVAIMGLLITSASSLPIQQTSSQEDEIVAEFIRVYRQPMAKTTNVNNPMNPLFESVPITGGDFDEFHPSVAGSPAGGFYAMMEMTEDDSIWYPNLYGSADGVVWDPILSATYANAQYTDMDQNAYGTYGTFGAPPDLNGQIVVMQGEIEDGWVWDFGANNINDFRSNHIACYTFEGPEGDPGNWNWGALTMVGYQGYASPFVSGCPFVFYQSDAEGSGIIGWLSGTVSDCEHVSSVIDPVKNVLYSVYDRFNGTGYELLVRKDNMAIWQWNAGGGYWAHPYMTSMRVNDPLGLTYPSVAANNNSVIIACQKGSDVVAYYSTNGFSSKTEVAIETGANYPEVVFAANGIAVITYIKDNIIYSKTSENGGATWSTAAQVSDSQANLNDRGQNIDEFQGSVYGVWEDTRGANIDIYYDAVYEFAQNPPSKPTLDGPTKLKKDTEYPYTFLSVDPDGDDVLYNVEWGDGASTGWISETTASHTWTTKAKFIIRCQAKDTYGALSEYTELQVSTPKSRTIAFRLFDYFPNAFPLLRLVLGY